MDIEIIKFEDSHLDDIADLEKQCFSIPWTKEMFEEELKSRLAHYLVAICGYKVIGYVGMWHILDEGQITNIAVLKDYRRMGIGEKLLAELTALAEKLEIKMITLEVREGNIGAQRLYEKLGFEVVGRRKNYYSDTNEAAILMTKF